MRRNFIIIGALVVIILLVGFGSVYYKHYKYDKNLIHSKDTGLTNDEKQVFINHYNDDLNKLRDKSISKDEQYRLYVDIGLQYYVLGDYDNARKYLLMAKPLFPDNIEAYNQLFSVDNAMHDYMAAQQDIDKALSISRTDAQLWRNKIDLEKQYFNPTQDQVKDLYNQALTATADNIDIITVYAQYLESINDLQGAVTEWKDAITKNPSSTALYQAEIDRIQAKLR